MKELIETPQPRICIYIANPKMIKILKEMYPNVHKDAWTTNEYIMFYLTTKTYQRHFGRPPIKYFKSYGIAIIDSGVKLRKLMLLIELGLTPEEISCTLRGV